MLELIKKTQEEIILFDYGFVIIIQIKTNIEANSNLEEIRNKVLPILKQMGVIRSSLFGSYVRGENKEDGDVDILVDLPRGKSLFDLVELQMKLEKVLGKKIGVVTYKSLHPLLKDRILVEQTQIL